MSRQPNHPPAAISADLANLLPLVQLIARAAAADAVAPSIPPCTPSGDVRPASRSISDHGNAINGEPLHVEKDHRDETR
ncbi:MAG: hypothetical protein HQ492_00110 [Woeseiaceae bacterium]|nr:hypothetical protein [Woeseiaceae bacterium]